MTIAHELKSLSDETLLRRLTDLVQRSRRVEAVLIAHIAEVDARRLYIREASSMFAYCTQVLHLSEHEAYARITVARASRRHPVLLTMLRDGQLHVSGIAKLAPHLTVANCQELLARAAHRTKSEIEELLAEIAPKPDVPAVIRKVPVPSAATSTAELGPDRVHVVPETLPRRVPAATVHAAHPGPDSRVPPRLEPPPSTLQAPAITALSPARYKVQFTARTELRDKLERLQALLREDLATAIETAVAEKLDRLEAKRFALTRTPRRTLEATDTSPRSRHLPAAVRRSVHERDGDRCTFVLRNGNRCPEHRGLEFHHREAYGRGGNHDPENVGVMCRQHNAYVAELDYGKEHMAKFRRRGDESDRVTSGDREPFDAPNPLNERCREGETAAPHDTPVECVR